MNLEEVKEHFKDAEKVRCLHGRVYSFKDMTERGIYGSTGYYWFYAKSRYCIIWSEKLGFAEIISYKKDAQRIKEDCELLDKFVSSLNNNIYSKVGINFRVELFKKDNGLIIEPDNTKLNIFKLYELKTKLVARKIQVEFIKECIKKGLVKKEDTELDSCIKQNKADEKAISEIEKT